MDVDDDGDCRVWWWGIRDGGSEQQYNGQWPMAGGAEKDAGPGSACAARPSVVGRDYHAVPAGSYSDAVLSCCASIYSEGDGRWPAVQHQASTLLHCGLLWMGDGSIWHLLSFSWKDKDRICSAAPVGTDLHLLPYVYYPNQPILTLPLLCFPSPFSSSSLLLFYCACLLQNTYFL